MNCQLQPNNEQFTHPSLPTRQSALVLKVGAPYGWQNIYKETGLLCCANKFEPLLKGFIVVYTEILS